MADELAPASPAGPASLRACFMDGLEDRIAMMNFLDLTYVGGPAYKYGCDARGQPILIEHEAEMVGGTMTPRTPVPNGSSGMFTAPQSASGRYARRLRMAAFENHFKPIVDKVLAYVTRTSPTRSSGEAVQKRIKPLHLDRHMAALELDGLKFGEGWLGYDTSVPSPKDGEPPLTVAQVEQIDPVNKGQPYLHVLDPRRVVDFDQADDGTITRVVVEEIRRTKASFVDDPKCDVYYKEWFPDHWVLYQRTGQESGGTPELKEVERGNHGFAGVPYYRHNPSFPTEDLAELNRALFNLTSLQDEELYGSTFTQKWITGVKPSDVSGAMMGVGNTLILEPSEAKVGVFGAAEGQAASIKERCDSLRDAVYRLVGMENAAQKNVAEAAEKKRRDLESLYTMLVQLSQEMEETENRLLRDLGIATDENDNSVYDTKFDVLSVAELMDEIEKLAAIPFTPASLLRRMATQIAQKMDPFGNHNETDEEIDERTVNITSQAVDAVSTLKTAGALTPDMAVNILGVPEAQQEEFKKRFEEHAAESDPFARGQEDVNGNPAMADEENADGGPSPLPFGGEDSPGAPKPPRPPRGFPAKP